MTDEMAVRCAMCREMGRDCEHDTLPFAYESAPTVNVTTRRCRHPRDLRTPMVDPLGRRYWRCDCGHEADPGNVIRGRHNRSRGNAKERKSAQRDGTVRTGHHGGKDDYRIGSMFAVQNKSMSTARFPGWMTAELDDLRRAWPSHEPVLHVEENPGSGHRAHELYVVDEKTWRALHGETTP